MIPLYNLSKIREHKIVIRLDVGEWIKKLSSHKDVHHKWKTTKRHKKTLKDIEYMNYLDCAYGVTILTEIVKFFVCSWHFNKSVKKLVTVQSFQLFYSEFQY